MTLQRLWRNNGLSIVLFVMFSITLYGQAQAGWRREIKEQREHNRPVMSFGAYLGGPSFLEATAENWESEFLQMAVYVWLTAFLFQKGSAESKDPDKASEEVDRKPDPNRPGAPWPVRRGGVALWLYERSLLLALVVMFGISLLLHAIGGSRVYAESKQMHGESSIASVAHYLNTSQFWFESLQNWQSEFFSVLLIVVLSIFLRQHGSPESKPVDAAHSDTGES